MRRAPQRPSARRRSYRSRCRWTRCGSPTEFRRTDVCRQWSNVDPRRGPLCPCHQSSTVATAAPLTSRSLPSLLPVQRLPSRPCSLPLLPRNVRPTISVPNQRLGAQSPCRVAAGNESYVPCGVASTPQPQHMVVLQASVTAHVVVWLQTAFVTDSAARAPHGPRMNHAQSGGQPGDWGRGGGFVTAPSRCGGQSSRGSRSRSAAPPQSR